MSLQIHSRAEWFALPPKRPNQRGNLNRGVIVHWNGPPMGAYSMDAVPSIIRSTQNFHMFTRGWNNIAYNHSGDRFGRVWEGRGIDIVNAASGDNFANYYLHAFELLVGEGEPFSDELKQATIEYVRFQWERGVEHTLYVHNDVAATSCPGSEISQWVRTELPVILDPIEPPPVVPFIGDDVFYAYRKPNNETVYIRNGATGEERPLNDLVIDSHDHMAVLNRMVEIGACRPLVILQDTPVDWDVNYALAVMDDRADPV